MLKSQQQRYIQLCKQYYSDREFMEWVALHTMRAKNEDAWLKLLNDSEE